MALFLIVFIVMPIVAILRFLSKKQETSSCDTMVDEINLKELHEENEARLKHCRELLEEIRQARREAGIVDEDDYEDDEDEDDDYKDDYDDEDYEDDEDDVDDLLDSKKEKHPCAKALGLGMGIGIVSGLTGHHIGIGGHSCNGNS